MKTKVIWIVHNICDKKTLLNSKKLKRSDYVSTGDKKIYAGGSGRIEIINTGCTTGKLGNKCGGGFGNYVTVAYNIEGINYYVVYAHMKHVNENLAIGDIVNQSTVLGIEGSTGNSTGSHVHIEIRARENTTEALNESYKLANTMLKESRE